MDNFIVIELYNMYKEEKEIFQSLVKTSYTEMNINSEIEVILNKLGTLNSLSYLVYKKATENNLIQNEKLNTNNELITHINSEKISCINEELLSDFDKTLVNILKLLQSDHTNITNENTQIYRIIKNFICGILEIDCIIKSIEFLSNTVHCDITDTEVDDSKLVYADPGKPYTRCYEEISVPTISLQSFIIAIKNYNFRNTSSEMIFTIEEVVEKYENDIRFANSKIIRNINELGFLIANNMKNGEISDKSILDSIDKLIKVIEAEYNTLFN